MGHSSIEPKIRRIFQWYGNFAYRWRWLLFIVPLLITPLFTIGFIRLNTLKIDDPTYVFTPRDARFVDIYIFINLVDFHKSR